MSSIADEAARPDSSGGAPPAFHLLAKPTGAQCNLDCDYCFFLSKEMLYPDSRFRMSDQQLDAYLRQLIESHARVPEVTIAWQGGEPTLMGLEFFRRSVEIADKYLKPGQRAVHTIQTNGTLIDADWAEFFKANEYLVGISIDGPSEIHDAYRVTKGGRGSFEKVMHGLGHLRDAGVEFNASLPQQCLDCDVRFACHGGCPKDRFIHTADAEPGLNYLCDGYLAFFHHIDQPMRIMCDLLNNNRAPSEIVQIYAAMDAQRGRNDPCTCGNGRKWKQCHGQSRTHEPQSRN